MFHYQIQLLQVSDEDDNPFPSIIPSTMTAQNQECTSTLALSHLPYLE